MIYELVWRQSALLMMEGSLGVGVNKAFEIASVPLSDHCPGRPSDVYGAWSIGERYGFLRRKHRY